jgi:hypothetical protein
MRPAVNDDLEPACCDSRGDLHLDVEHVRPDLGKPEVVFLDEVEAKPIAPRGTWRDYLDGDLGARTWRYRVRQRAPGPVPHDCVAMEVEPVVGDLQAAGPDRSPGRRSRIFERYDGAGRNPGSALGQGREVPARCERLDARW